MDKFLNSDMRYPVCFDDTKELKNSGMFRDGYPWHVFIVTNPTLLILLPSSPHMHIQRRFNQHHAKVNIYVWHVKVRWTITLPCPIITALTVLHMYLTGTAGDILEPVQDIDHPLWPSLCRFHLDNSPPQLCFCMFQEQDYWLLAVRLSFYMYLSMPCLCFVDIVIIVRVLGFIWSYYFVRQAYIDPICGSVFLTQHPGALVSFCCCMLYYFSSCLW